jgi:carbonic anhydrase/acetyltransferase-like protein (isoleucine patch superfamily)
VAVIQSFRGKTPKIGERVYLDSQARIIGNVEIGNDSSVWPMVVIRGDMNAIRIGHSCSIQDGSVLHITHDSQYHPGGHSLSLGDRVTVGHNAVLHGCHIESDVLIGMSATVMDGAYIESQCIIAAGCLVPPGKQLQKGFLYRGQPCQKARALTQDELKYFLYTANNYKMLKDEYLDNI